jgi:hypothetical protein
MNSSQTLAPKRAQSAWNWDTKQTGSRSDQLAALEALAFWLDSAFHIPILGTRVGFDAIIGLIPGIGDALTSFASLFILRAASKYGVPRTTLARMGLNIGIDWLVGSIPFLGDMFDAYWKSNVKNVTLLKRHLNETPLDQRRNRRGDRLFVFGVITLLLLVLAASVAAAIAMVTWLAHRLF